MADSAAFEGVCEVLERSDRLDRLESRGTVRLALTHAGLEASSVTAAQMTVVLEQALPRQLRSRGARDADSLLRHAVTALAPVASAADPQCTPPSASARPAA